MRVNTANGGHAPRYDDPTVSFINRPSFPNGPRRAPAAPADGVTALVPGAVLAPAPTPDPSAGAAEVPVFVDDSGSRKRLLRVVGVLIGLLSVGFLAVIGVALAVPSVANMVGLGNVTPFIVPGAAAPPPIMKAPVQPKVMVVKPKPKPKAKPKVVVTTKPKPVVVSKPPVVQPPVVQAPVSQVPVSQPPVSKAPVSKAPVSKAPVSKDPVSKAPVTKDPVSKDPDSGQDQNQDQGQDQNQGQAGQEGQAGQQGQAGQDGQNNPPVADDAGAAAQ